MSGTQHGPMDQFLIKPLVHFELGQFDLSFTNSSLFMVIAVILSVLTLTLPLRNAGIIPGRWQSSVELIYQMMINTLQSTAGKEALKYFPLVFTIFLFIITCNLLGMVPYGFTVTSQIIITFALGITVFCAVTIIGFVRHGLHFLSLFLPQGVPKLLAPLIIVIELITYLARPCTLAIRLAANMMAGHVLLKVLGGFVVMMGIFWGWVPIPFIVLLTGFEIFVAILQAYIFTILTCVYLNDAVNLH